MSTPLLWQFRFSHFNEKIRWALDYKGIEHQKRNLVPGLHIAPVLLRSGQRQLPLLVTEGGVVTDSRNIVAELEQRKPEPALYPADKALRDKALEWETWLGENFGPHARRVFFYHLIKNQRYMGELLTYGMRAPAAMMYRLGLPVTTAIMRMDMSINEKEVARSTEEIDVVFTRLEKERGPSGFLVGDQFTIADLTAAALTTPLMNTPYYPYPIPQPLSAEIESLFQQYADRDAVKWCHDLYARFRGTTPNP